MKRLLKHEWKYYLFFSISVLVCMIIGTRWNCTGMDMAGTSGFINIYLYLVEIVGSLNYLVLERAVKMILAAILILKLSIFWTEKDSWGREFFQSLPIRRRDRVCFHFLMDSLLVFFLVIIYMIFLYIHMIIMLGTQNLEIPWLWKALCGQGITCICYLLFLLGVVNFLEIIFVDGIIKIFGTVSVMGMLNYMLAGLFDINQTSVLFQNLYGFFSMKGAGNNIYDRILRPEILYRGEMLDYGAVISEQIETNANVISYLDVSCLYDFSRCSSYIGYALGYLGLMCVFLGLSIWLSDKQELSEQGFYFSFGKYLFSAVLCGTFFVILIGQASVLWHKYIIFISSILLFIVLVYAMSTNKDSCLSY